MRSRGRQSDTKRSVTRKHDFQPLTPLERHVRINEAYDLSGRPTALEIRLLQRLGQGSFGVVHFAELPKENNEQVAVKKFAIQTGRVNRELDILKLLDHPNIIKLRYYFTNTDGRKNEYMSLVLEYVPRTVDWVIRDYASRRRYTPIIYVKLYMFQIFKALTYLHSLGICHRDIKPQNLLVNPDAGVLKVGDFGSAKQLKMDEPNVLYMCSRFYRAPELVLTTEMLGTYTTAIDIWSTGTVMAEFLLSAPIFECDSGTKNLMAEFVRVLGSPTRAQLEAMGKNKGDFNFPYYAPAPWCEQFPRRTDPMAIDLISKLIVYVPAERLSPRKALGHQFFDELRDPDTRLEGKPLPPNLHCPDEPRNGNQPPMIADQTRSCRPPLATINDDGAANNK